MKINEILTEAANAAQQAAIAVNMKKDHKKPKSMKEAEELFAVLICLHVAEAENEDERADKRHHRAHERGERVEQPAEGLCGLELRGGDAGAGVVEHDVGGIPALVGGVGRVGVDVGQVEVALGDGDADGAECGDDRGRGRGCHYCPSAGVTGAAGSAGVTGAASTTATGAAGSAGVGATVTVLEPTPNAVVHGVM